MNKHIPWDLTLWDKIESHSQKQSQILALGWGADAFSSLFILDVAT